MVRDGRAWIPNLSVPQKHTLLQMNDARDEKSPFCSSLDNVKLLKITMHIFHCDLHLTDLVLRADRKRSDNVQHVIKLRRLVY